MHKLFYNQKEKTTNYIEMLILKKHTKISLLTH